MKLSWKIFTEIKCEHFLLNGSILDDSYMTVKTRAWFCDYDMPALVSLPCVLLHFALNVYTVSCTGKVCGLLSYFPPSFL